MDGNTPPRFREDRHPAETYEEILERDRIVAEHLRQGPRWDAGTGGIPVERCYDPDYFKKEVEHVWLKIWQWACREEDIPNVGDYHIYEIVGKSLIVVRTQPDEIKAFYNSCLHRARKLVTLNGSKKEFRCPFHGFTWNCDGTFKENPIGWDFPQWKDRDMSLPEAKVDTWGGFVFINFDQDALPLQHYIGPLAEHFERYDYKNRFIAVHVQKVVKANWKITAEAFMESHHSLATHPQILPTLADANSQYDFLNDYVTRHFSAGAVPSPFLDPRPTESEILAFMTGRGGSGGRRRVPENAEIPAELPDGTTARAFMAELSRKALSEQYGKDFSEVPDAEVLDALLYNLFPHMSFWAGFAPTLVYRWRPVGLDPERSTMEIIILSPLPKDGVRPPSAPIRHLGEDDHFSEVEDILGPTAQVFQQDMGNLPYVQEGLHASGSGMLEYGRYSEGRIRQMHQLIHQMIEDGERAKAEAVAGQA